MRRADIEVPNPAVDVDSWAGSACYPRGSFYPLSHGRSTTGRGITRPAFRPCSACPPRSQAPFCPCTRRVVTIHPEGTVGRLRYSLGGDRPSQTAHQPPSPARLTARGERSAPTRVVFHRRLPAPPRGHPPRLPPILRKLARAAMASCSKAPRGLFVLPREGRIFTATSISPRPPSRQRPDRDTFRAGRNLPDKEFRYLRTVIVTAAVYRGFGSRARTAPLNLPALGRCQPPYVPSRVGGGLCLC